MAFELSITLEIFCISRSFTFTPFMQFIQLIYIYISMWYIISIRLFKIHSNSVLCSYFLCASKAPYYVWFRWHQSLRARNLQEFVSTKSRSIHWSLYRFTYFCCYFLLAPTKYIALFIVCVCVRMYSFLYVFHCFWSEAFCVGIEMLLLRPGDGLCLTSLVSLLLQSIIIEREFYSSIFISVLLSPIDDFDEIPLRRNKYSARLIDYFGSIHSC